MVKCKHCKKEVTAYHHVYPETFESFHLCVDCFEEFYSESLAALMYEYEQQYYTEDEEESEA